MRGRDNDTKPETGQPEGRARRESDMQYGSNRDKKTMLACSEVAEWLDAWVEGELNVVQRTAVETHLGDCADCSEEVAELQRERLWILSNALLSDGEVESGDLPADFAASITQAIREEELVDSDLSDDSEPTHDDASHQAAQIEHSAASSSRRSLLAIASPFLSGIAAVLVLSFLLLAPEPTGTPRQLASPSESAVLAEKGTEPDAAERRLAMAAVSLEVVGHADAGVHEEDGVVRACFLTSTPARAPREFFDKESGEYCPAIDQVTTVAVPALPLSPAGDDEQLGTPARSRAAKLRSSPGVVHHVTSTILQRPGLGENDEPCVEDLNADGRTDVRDVAIGYQLLMHSGPWEAGSLALVVEPECVNPCAEAGSF